MRKILISLSLFLLIACSGEIPNQGEISTVEFNQLFTAVNNGQYTPKHPIKIGGVSMGKGLQMGGLAQIGGVQLDKIKNKNIVIKNVNGVMVIQSIE
ncbi:hypothetical protein [Colwellia sp. E150_009]